MDLFILAQIIGVVAVGFELLSYQCRKKRNMLVCDALAAIFYGIHYFLLSAFSGGWSQIIILARTICVLIKDEEHRKWNGLFWIFIAAYIVVGILTFDAWYSILAIIASLMFLVATWKFKDAQKIRYLALPAKILWLIYNICVVSIPGIIAKTLAIISILLGLWRNRKVTSKKKRVKRKKKS